MTNPTGDAEVQTALDLIRSISFHCSHENFQEVLEAVSNIQDPVARRSTLVYGLYLIYEYSSDESVVPLIEQMIDDELQKLSGDKWVDPEMTFPSNLLRTLERILPLRARAIGLEERDEATFEERFHQLERTALLLGVPFSSPLVRQMVGDLRTKHRIADEARSYLQAVQGNAFERITTINVIPGSPRMEFPKRS